MKTGKLTMSEKYAIQGMINEGKDLDFISNTLDRRPKIINEYLASIAQSQAKIEENSVVAKSSRTKDMMINKTPGGRQVSIMTPAASQNSDETKKNYSAEQGRNAKGNIYRIQEDSIE